MKRVTIIIALMTLWGCSKKDTESAVSSATVSAVAYALNYNETKNPELAAQCAKSVNEKYSNLTDVQKIATFAPKVYKGWVATFRCEASQMKLFNDLAIAKDIGAVQTPMTCFEKDNVEAMQALEPATREFIIPICSASG